MPVLRNARQEKFAQELVKGKSIVDAYEAAGYVRDWGNGTKLRYKPHVAARVDELLGRAAAKAEVTAERVLRELALIGFANMKRNPRGDVAGVLLEYASKHVGGRAGHREHHLFDGPKMAHRRDDEDRRHGCRHG